MPKTVIVGDVYNQNVLVILSLYSLLNYISPQLSQKLTHVQRKRFVSFRYSSGLSAILASSL